MSKAVFIVNPRASNGRCGRIWRNILAPWLEREHPGHDVRLTERGGHATDLAREAAAAGRAVISVGGDGTHNEVVSGLLASDRIGNIVFGCLTLGTGGDFRRTLQLPRDPIEQAAELLQDLADGQTIAIDAGRLEYIDHDGQQATRGFLNIASFGIGGEVDDRVNRTTKMFGGFASFLIGSIRANFAYRNRPVRITIDGKELPVAKVFNVAVANGRFFGGGMQIAPNALPCDGLFDIVSLGDLTFAQKLAFASRVYRGTHLSVPGVEVRRGRVVKAVSDDVVLLDVDGEQPGRLPATFSIVPEALLLLGGSRLRCYEE
ncbi:MAG: diacylglycerol kinase family lipid kinase [Candidatus Dadabacteria bacterium]|nr:MAG: diacylglycerol kinase family lipid kinase [Candidatus Dadabacteria bacterium]